MKQLTPFIRRKYYLHRQLKGYCDISSRRRVVSLTECQRDEITGLLANHFNELINRYKYRIQYSMPI